MAELLGLVLNDELKDLFSGKDILVTGGTGSFGKEIVRTVLDNYSVRRLIIFSRDELKQSEMAQAFEEHPNNKCLRFFLGDVRDEQRLNEAFYGVNYIIHAAALKQVPAIEYNPFEAIKTNVMGAKNVISASIAQNVRKVIALSTDKACNPVNLYGASKLCSDKLFISANAFGGRRVSFSVVRYGNVFGSRGSVVGFFLKKKEQKTGSLPITDPNMTRFSITLRQAVSLVLNSFLLTHGGEILIPKIPSYRITDLAAAVAPTMSAHVVGIRPGEKLHEVMVPTDEAVHTLEFKDYFMIYPAQDWWNKTDALINQGGKPVPESFCYASNTNTQWLTVDQLRQCVNEYIEQEGYFSKTLMDDSYDRNLMERRNDEEHKSDKLAIDGGKPVLPAFIPYGCQTITNNDIEAVISVLRSTYLTTGPKVEEFETAVCTYVNASYGVAVTSGTAALHAAMYAIGIKHGDEVIVPTMTFAASANCVIYQGGTPVFCDILPDNLNIDPECVERLITAKTKAIIAVDYAGQPCDFNKLSEIAKKHNIVLVEDASHSIGASYKGRKVGSLADITTFSFHPVKNMTTGEGGMIVTNSKEWADKMRTFRNHGITTDYKQREQKGTFYYEMMDLGFNYRLTDIQCALGISQLKMLDSWVARRQEIAMIYDSHFSKIPQLKLLTKGSDVKHAYHLYVVKVQFNALITDKVTLFKALRAEGVGINVHYIPVHLHPYYQNQWGTKIGVCPVAEAMYEEVISLPMYPALSPKEQYDIIRAVIKVLGAFSMLSQ